MRVYECFECKKRLSEGDQLIGEFRLIETKFIKTGLGTIHFCSWNCLSKFAQQKEKIGKEVR